MSESYDSFSIEGSREPIDEDRFATLEELQEATGVDLLNELTELFLADVPRRASDLRAAVEARDVEAAKRLAHSIKGSCSNLGAQRVETVAIELEKRIATGDSGRLAALLDQLEVEIEHASKALVELRT